MDIDLVALKAAYDKHRAKAIACNFTGCGCEFCIALDPLFAPAQEAAADA